MAHWFQRESNRCELLLFVAYRLFRAKVIRNDLEQLLQPGVEFVKFFPRINYSFVNDRMTHFGPCTLTWPFHILYQLGILYLTRRISALALPCYIYSFYSISAVWFVLLSLPSREPRTENREPSRVLSF